MSDTLGARSHAVRAGILWLVLIIVGEILLFAVDLLPDQYSVEAEIIDEAFILLSILAVPVFALVVAVVIYAALFFRPQGDGLEDGPPIKTNRKVVTTWGVVTSALALGVLINPGFVGLAALHQEQEADLVIGVEAQRWQWTLTYPNGAVVRDELVVPLEETVRFDITSLDVLHSFWVPAFRNKLDAVPGRTTQLYVTPTRTGTMEDDSGLRVQCAELCGLGHAVMAIPVRVLPEDEFEQWLADQSATAARVEERG